MRYSPRSLVAPRGPVCCSRRSALPMTYRIGVTWTSVAGSPSSSRIRPEMTAVRARVPHRAVAVVLEEAAVAQTHGPTRTQEPPGTNKLATHAPEWGGWGRLPAPHNLPAPRDLPDPPDPRDLPVTHPTHQTHL